jgi:MFS family permease
MKIPGGFEALQRCFQIREYRLYAIGNIAHGLGVWILRMAMGWLTWELTKSTAWLGGIAMAEMAPTLIFALIAGTVVDRVNYFKMMRINQGLMMMFAAILSVLTVADLVNIWLLLVLTIFRGSLMAFNRPSRMTLVHHLVGRDLLSSAIAIGSMIHNGTRFIGPALGGLVIVTVGIGWAFAATAGLFLLYALLLAAMRVSIELQKREDRSMLVETLEGLTYIVGHGGIRLQLMLLIVVGMLAKPVTDLLPGFAGQVFSRGAEGLALLLSCHGIGATLGAIWLASRASGLKGMTLISIFSVLFLSFALLAFVATDILWLGLLFAGCLGFGFIVLNVSNQTLIQSAVDPRLRGRVISVYGLVLQGVPAIGALLIGGIADHIGLRIPIFIGGVICFGTWFLAWQRRTTLERSLEAESISR